MGVPEIKRFAPLVNPIVSSAIHPQPQNAEPPPPDLSSFSRSLDPLKPVVISKPATHFSLFDSFLKIAAYLVSPIIGPSEAVTGCGARSELNEFSGNAGSGGASAGDASSSTVTTSSSTTSVTSSSSGGGAGGGVPITECELIL